MVSKKLFEHAHFTVDHIEYKKLQNYLSLGYCWGTHIWRIISKIEESLVQMTNILCTFLF